MVGEFRVRFKYRMAIVGDCFFGRLEHRLGVELPLAEGTPSMFCLSPAPPNAKTLALLALGSSHSSGIRFKYMELARVYDLSAVNQLHLQSFQI
jgi:hypothetical protein